MNVTRHQPTDPKFFDQMKMLERELSFSYIDTSFGIITKPGDLIDDGAACSFYLASNPSPLGLAMVNEFNGPEFANWIYHRSTHEIVNRRGGKLSFENMLNYEPFNNQPEQSAFICEIEAYRKKEGVGKTLINHLKDTNDSILLISSPTARAFYEKMQFKETQFKWKYHKHPKSFHYWIK